MSHIESISNGLGSQSMYLMVMAADGEIPATVSITADTGAEEDRLWSTGERTTAREYFERVVVPFGERHGIDVRFVRARDKQRREMISLGEHTARAASAGKLTNIKIPVFGSDGGRLGQSCTSRWKVAAINQELRRLGAKTARTAQGIHHGEASRRVKGKYIGPIGGFETYQTTVKRRGRVVLGGVEMGVGVIEKPVRWLTHYYPLVDRRLKRQEIRECLERRGIPYLISTECDFCPHQDIARWLRHTPESLAVSAALEASFGGEYFLTDRRIPLLRAVAEGAALREAEMELDFGCGNSYCGV